MKLILASGSARRRELLAGLGLSFSVEVPELDEHRHPGEEPDAFVERIARAKASVVAGPHRLVVAADTTVVIDGQILGKPAHPEEARSMLRRLSGKTHEVLTGVAVARWGEAMELQSAVETTLVRFLALTEEEIDDYVATGEPMDKAGAYALQGLAAIYVESVTGSPSNVVGLPLHTLARLCRGAGVDLLSFRQIALASESRAQR
jgi:septum formation protein